MQNFNWLLKYQLLKNIYLQFKCQVLCKKAKKEIANASVTPIFQLVLEG